MGNPEVGEDSSHAFGRSLDGDLTWRRHFQHVAVLVAAEPSASRPPNSGRLKKVACTLAACEMGGNPVVVEAVNAAPSIVKVRKVSFYLNQQYHHGVRTLSGSGQFLLIS